MAEARIDTLRRLYEAFNARDVEAVLARLHPDVDWPDMIERRRLHGREAVRDYWQRQFTTLDPHVEPLGFTERGDEVSAHVHQRIRDVRTGAVLAENDVVHVHRFDGDLIAALEVR